MSNTRGLNFQVSGVMFRFAGQIVYAMGGEYLEHADMGDSGGRFNSDI